MSALALNPEHDALSPEREDHSKTMVRIWHAGQSACKLTALQHNPHLKAASAALLS